MTVGIMTICDCRFTVDCCCPEHDKIDMSSGCCFFRQLGTVGYDFNDLGRLSELSYRLGFAAAWIVPASRLLAKHSLEAQAGWITSGIQTVE